MKKIYKAYYIYYCQKRIIPFLLRLILSVYTHLYYFFISFAILSLYYIYLTYTIYSLIAFSIFNLASIEFMYNFPISSLISGEVALP